VLVVDACRAVGIPARVAGVPAWTGSRGNHTWAEVWDGSWGSRRNNVYKS
jgi:transglutaminase-like putative cysteine protease